MLGKQLGIALVKANIESTYLLSFYEINNYLVSFNQIIFPIKLCETQREK